MTAIGYQTYHIIAEDFMASIGQPTGNGDAATNMNLIQDWLQEEGWRTRKERIPDTLWALVATDDAQRALLIAQRRDRPEPIVIQATILVSEGDRDYIADLDADIRNEFFYDLQCALLQMGMDYQGVGDPFLSVTLNQRVYSDGLTRDQFMQRVAMTRNAVILALVKAARLTNQPPPAQESIGFQGTRR